MNSNELMALLVTALAGLSTGIGSGMAFFMKKTNKTFLAISLGFSAGVMIYVSFMEIIPKAEESLAQATSADNATWYTYLAFFGGIMLILLIDKLIPSFENPHEPHKIEQITEEEKEKQSLYRMGILTALAIAIHNFPEGMATFSAYIADPLLGVPIAIAIAIHNIPEGIAVSVPIYYSTGSRVKAFWLSFLSGISEPVGAIIGFGLLKAFFTEYTFGILFAAVAGVMVFVSVDELLPTAREYDLGHKAIYAIVAGMAVMGFSLLML